jgi:hypothetical protein
VVRSVRQAGWIGRRTPTEVGPDEVTTLDMRPYSRVGAKSTGASRHSPVMASAMK